jgi:electron transport complex protein RnfE
VRPGDVRRRLWGENPLLTCLVGLCPALAVSNRLVGALLLAAVMLFALLGTGIASAGLEPLLPAKLRLPARLLVASALVTAAQRFLWAVAPTLVAGLGVYLPLLAVNCLLLGSAGAGTLSESLLDAAGRGAAFAAALAALALLREALGAGTVTLFPIGSFRGVWRIRGLMPARVLAAAPGALLLLGYASALARRRSRRRS